MFSVDAEVFDAEYYMSYLDAELWCIVMGLQIWNQTGILVNISTVLLLGIPVIVEVSIPTVNNGSRILPRSQSNITLTKRYMSLFWEKFKWLFYAGYATFTGCVFGATAILERYWGSGVAWAISLGLLAGAFVAHEYMDLYVMPSIAGWAINEYKFTGRKEAVEAAIYLYRVIRFAMQHLILTIFVRWFTPHKIWGIPELLAVSGVNFVLLSLLYPSLKIPLHDAPMEIWKLGYSIIGEILGSPLDLLFGLIRGYLSLEEVLKSISFVVVANTLGFFFVRNDLVESFPTLVLIVELWYLGSSASTYISLLEGYL